MIERLSRLAAAVLAVCLSAAGAARASRFGRLLDLEDPGGDAARWTRGLR